MDTRIASRPSALSVGLRILSHPDMARVGELSVLFVADQRGSVEVSRTGPVFRSHNGTETAALATLHVSRTPLNILRANEDGCCLLASQHAKVTVEGEALDGQRQLSGRALQDGVVITLGRAVALWLGEFEVGPEPQLAGFVGVSAVAGVLKRKLAQLAPLTSPVLLLGSEGVGKAAAARVLHELSRHEGRPLLTVRTETAPQSALSALREHPPATLYVDELAGLNQADQAALVDAIDTQEGKNLLGTHASARTRILAGSTHDVRMLAERGVRRALLDRFAHVLELPDLAQRREDVAPMFVQFLREALRRFGAEVRLSTLDETAPPFVPAVLMAQLLRGAWPGNARQLRSFADAFALATHDQAQVDVDAWLAKVPAPARQPRSEPAGKLDDDAIRAALSACDYNVTRAAKLLKVSKSWLHPRIARSGLLPRARDLPAEQIEQALREARFDIARAAVQLRVSRHGLLLRMRALGIASAGHE